MKEAGRRITTRGRWSERLGTERGLLERTRGKAFLDVLAGMAAEPGRYVLDEPESALSFDGALMLLTLLSDMPANGSQIVLATHSPVLAAVPGAQLVQVDDAGLTPVRNDATDLVMSRRSFLAEPGAYLRHLT